MTDAKQEALRQALQFHNGHFGASLELEFGKPGKRSTADQIIATARKFEAFLDPHAKSRK